MSTTTLPEDAPVTDTDVPSVEDPAPESQGAVAEDSVDTGSDTKVVSAERFNGLMSTFNKAQSELEAQKARVAALEARLTETESPKEEPVNVSTDISSLEAQVNQLSAMLVEERLESARAQAVRDYPEAAALADLIVGDTPEDIRNMARTIAERIRPPGTAEAQAPAEPDPSSEPDTSAAAEDAGTSEASEPPVIGGGAAYSGEASADDRISQAITAGDFSSFLEAKWEKTLMSSGTGSLA